MRGTYGSPLRLVTAAAKLTAKLIEEIEAHTFGALKAVGFEGKLGTFTLGVSTPAIEGLKSLSVSELLEGALLWIKANPPGGTQTINFTLAESIKNNVAISHSAVDLNAEAAGAELSGMQTNAISNEPGPIVVLTNTSAKPVTLLHQSVKSEERNRFRFRAGVNRELKPGESLLVVRLYTEGGKAPTSESERWQEL